jgi:hypothetical protein
MSRLDGHIDGRAGDHVELVAVDGGAACAADDEPVFFTPRMALIAEPLARPHGDPLDLVAGSLGEPRVRPPRPFIMLPPQVTSRIVSITSPVSCQPETFRQSTPIASTG